MPTGHGGFTRRSFLKRAGAVSLGTIAARGVYDMLDEIAGTPTRAAAAGATVRRRQEQYLVDSVQVILDNGVTCAIPPIHNDVITAKLAGGRDWSISALKTAQSRLENALATVERPYPSTAAGLTMVIGWGLPYFGTFITDSIRSAKLPVDVSLPPINGKPQYAVLDAIQFPSDPDTVLLEDNHLMFKLRSDSSEILHTVEDALFDNPTSGAYIGDLFDVTSKRMGFLGRGFGTTSVGKTLALAADVPGAASIPDRAQLMLGFTSTQTGALGPDNIVSFETLPGVTNQFPSGYFAGGCAMHLSHLFEDLELWYSSGYASRVGKMFSQYATVPPDPSTVTLPNGPGEVVTKDQLLAEAGTGQIGHNSPLQRATRLPGDVTDNYGRLRKKGTAVPLREDFNTIDNPFAWTANPGRDDFSTTGAAGMHFVAFVPASSKFHAARKSMDGVLPDGTNLRTSYNLTDANIGINAAIRASHRQNYLVPPRAHRSFPLVELMK